MSLLDDVSIVVTPNGYKAGELYAVIPVPTEGAEILSQPVDLVTDFIVNSGGVIVDADTFDTFGGTYDGIRKNFCFTVGKRYKLTIQGDTTSSGFTMGDTSGSGNQYGSGFGTFYFTAVGNGSLWIRQQTSGTTNITSFTVKEYTSADMDVTRATAATRVDGNGLVNYAEVLGGEEIVDGDFPSGTTAWTFGGGWSLGVDSAEATSGSSGKLSQTNTLNGKYAQVTLTVSNVGGAGLILIDYGSTGSAYITSDGTYTLYGTYDQDTFEIYKSATFSGTVTNISVKEVLRDNVPRIDYTGGGCPHILAEPQRTNIVYPSDVAVTQTRTVTAVEYALSFYGTGSIVLSGTHSATLTGTGVNDRVDLIFTPTAGSLVLTVSGTVTNFQLEVGSYATSLIPTVSGTVTRNQDQFTRDGIGSLINSTEGVLFVEMAAIADDLTYRRIGLSNSTSNNRVDISYDDVSNRIRGQVIVGGVNSALMTFVATNITQNSKIALKYKLNDFALWINGTEVATDTSGSVYAVDTLNKLSFDNGAGGNIYSGKVKQLQVYKTALTDTQLAALTS